MIGHYLTVAFRNFRRSPVATGINVLTLALGLVCFLVAYAVVGYWERSEQHFAKAERTYVVTTDFALKEGGVATGVQPATADFLAKYLKADFPELEAVARARAVGEVSVSAGSEKTRLQLGYADPAFLDIFDLPFLAKANGNALAPPDAVILTERAARRLFGATDVVGRGFTISRNIDVTVTGVIDEIPQPSHLGTSEAHSMRYEILASWRVFERVREMGAAQAAGPDPDAGESAGPPEPPENWLGNFCCTTYALLPENGFDAEAFKARLADFDERRVPDGQRDVATLEFGAIPVSEIMVTQLNSLLFGQAAPGLSITSVLLVLGGLVLAVACLNYANVATAQAAGRAKEVGMRKVVGARRGQVVAQHLLEAVLLTIAALIIAVAAVEAVTPVVRSAMNIDLGLALFSGLGFWGFVLGLIAAVSLAAGAYPALILSRIRPIEALRTGGLRMGPRILAATLVGVQFFAASFLLIAIIVMYTQNRELRQSGLGTAEAPLIVMGNMPEVTGVEYETLRTELVRRPEIESVAGINNLPWALQVRLMIFARTPEETAREHTTYENNVSYNYFSTMDVDVLAGRIFEQGRDAEFARSIQDIDPNKSMPIVIDRRFSEQLGFESPAAAVDETIYIPARLIDAMGGEGAQPARILGVVENKALHFIGIGATSNLYTLRESPDYVIMRAADGRVSEARAAAEAVWNDLAPDLSPDIRFMDTLFEQSYEMFRAVNQAFTGLAIFAFIIAAIGLFGMAGQIAGRRTHEIGVRKTLGARTGRIVAMLLKDFSKPVVIANLVAWPLGFLAAQVYLSVFMHRIDLTPVPFVLSLAITLGIAWAAVAGQAWRASRVRPAQVLRYE